MENKDIKICIRINPHINKQLEDIKSKLNNVPREFRSYWWYSYDNNSKVIRTMLAIFSELSEEEINELYKKHRTAINSNM